jgi:hypothetical protein
MEKFTKRESGIIIASLENAMSDSLHDIQAGEEAGKTPLFTEEFVKQTYEDLIQRIKGMSRKH